MCEGKVETNALVGKAGLLGLGETPFVMGLGEVRWPLSLGKINVLLFKT